MKLQDLSLTHTLQRELDEIVTKYFWWCNFVVTFSLELQWFLVKRFIALRRLPNVKAKTVAWQFVKLSPKV